MSNLIILATTALLSLMAAMVVYSRKRLLYKWCAVVLSTFLVVGTPIIMWELLSRPKLVSQELFKNPDEVLLIADFAEQGVALHLWVLLPNYTEPRFYSVPWEEGGRELSRAISRAKEQAQGQPLVIPFLFEKSLEKEKQPYPLPQPKLPLKGPEPKVREFGA